MKPHPLPDTEQTRIVQYVTERKHAIYGSYVYKTAVNGDPAGNINIAAKDRGVQLDLKNELGRNFDCKPVLGVWKEEWEDGFGIELECPAGRIYIGGDYTDKTPIFDLRLKKPQLVCR